MGSHRWLRAAALCCVAALCLAADSEAVGEDGVDSKSTITVSGVGRVSAAPDMAQISVGVLTQGPTAQVALASNNEAMARLVEIVKERGVAAKDIQTSSIAVNPQYSQQPPPAPGVRPRPFVPQIVAYQVTNSVQITARKIADLGPLLDAVVQAGANQINGISFRINEPEPLLDQARKGAIADARRKAELLAGEAGVVLGPPLAINESSSMPRPMPMYRGGAMMMAADAAPAMPVEAGEQELTASVTVVFELKLPKAPE